MLFPRWFVLAACSFVTVLVLSAGSPLAATPEDELPEGEGKKILLTSCTICHELDEVTKFRGYFDRAQWRDIVITMMEYGAPVDSRQVEVLTDYLVQHLGRR
jgi:hypothetical protein